jgi:hypothetical protein
MPNPAKNLSPLNGLLPIEAAREEPGLFADSLSYPALPVFSPFPGVRHDSTISAEGDRYRAHESLLPSPAHVHQASHQLGVPDTHTPERL